MEYQVTTRVHEGVEVRQTSKYPKLWVTEDGRVLGPTGKWLRPRSSNTSGHLAVGCRTDTGCGYLNPRVHRLVGLTWVHNPKPEEYLILDHIDCDVLNNTAANLRWTTPRGNNQNRKDTRDGLRTSKYVGVSWRTSYQKWRTSIMIDKQGKDIGYFIDEVAAAKAYDAALVELGLQPVNFPTPDAQVA